MKHLFFLILTCSQIIMTHAQPLDLTSSNPLHQALKNNPTFFKRITSNPDSFRVQIIYTQIDRNKRNKPLFKEYSYRLNNQEYFYPASTVKMPIALLALEKINELGIKGLTRNSIMITDSAATAQDHVYNQPNANDGAPTIENYIKQIFLVSDNDAFNRLYEFLGQEYIQRKLAEKGYPDVIIRHRLQLSRTTEQQAITKFNVFLREHSDVPLSNIDELSHAQLTFELFGQFATYLTLATVCAIPGGKPISLNTALQYFSGIKVM